MPKGAATLSASFCLDSSEKWPEALAGAVLHGRSRLGTMKNRLVAVLPQAARALGRIFVKVCKSAPSLNFLWTISEKRFIIAYHGEGSGSMRFTKMQGIGNDYIYVNCFEETVREPERLAVK